jgi:radical SAM protein with 4Fe4S-binding SPASM domain
LTETGDLYPCEEFSENMKIGNVRDADFDLKQLLRSDRAGEIFKFIEKKGCCCTHECYFMTNILFNPAHYPKLFKEYFQL